MWSNPILWKHRILFNLISVFPAALLILPVQEVRSVEQELILFAKNGNYFGFKNPVADISEFKLGNSELNKICIRGTWIVYEKINFQEFLFGLPYSQKLRCWPHNLKDLKSFRYLGDANSDITGISFYSGFNFEGTEALIHAPKLDNIELNSTNPGEISSFAISGDEPYTLFTEKNFQGESMCFKSPANSVDAYPDIDSFPVLKKIQSVQRGCSKGAVEHRPHSKKK